MKNAMKRMLAMLLVAILMVGFLPSYAFAAPVELPDSMPMVSDKESTLAPGVTLHEIVAYSGDGQRVEMYATIADLNVDTVEIYANYKDNEINNGWGFQTPADQAAAFEAKHPGKQVVAATNGSYYNLTTGEPEGVLVMEGVEAIKSNGDSNNYPFFAILKDGTPYIGQAWTYNNIKDNVKEAIAGKRLLVWNGEKQGLDYDYGDPGYKYPRNAIGVTADGKVVTLLADGYRSPYSDGTTLDELAYLMIELGCVAAVQLDGGGSGSLSTKPEGSDELELTSTPGDGGYARKVANSLVIVSTATASDVFHHADLAVENDFVTPGSTVDISVTGVSSTGHNANLPADIALQVKDAAMGTIVDGKYVGATGYTGDAVIQAVSGGKVVGETTIHVVIPDKIELSLEKMVVKYGNSKELEISAHYGLNPVAVKIADFAFTWANNAALGTIDGFNFIASEDTSLTGPVELTVTLVHNTALKDAVLVSLTDLPDKPVIVTDFEDQIPMYVDPTTLGHLREEYGIVDATTGKVHSGDYAFKIGITPGDNETPFLQGYFTGRVACGGANDNGMLDLTKVNLTNSQSFGVWIYIPEDSIIMSSAVTFGNSVSGESKKVRLYDYGYASTEAGHRGWQYFEVDTTPYNDGNWYIKSMFFTECCSRRPDQYSYQYGYQPAGHQSIDGYHEFYVDDITIEYLDLDVDREDPNFENITVNYGEVKDEILAGQTITGNVASFATKATDKSALDLDSVKVYVDGVALTEGITADKSGLITTGDITLADGTHNITFVISDEHGNCDYITRQVVVAADSKIPTVIIKGNANNPKDKEVLLESLFWLDVEVDNIEDVESIKMILNLDSVSAWELEGMELAYGFTAEYSVDPANNATITITKTGAVELTGHAVIAQLPIRVGDVYSVYASGRDKTSTVWEQGAIYWLPIDVRVTCDMGLVTYEDGTETSFAMENIDVASELTDWPYVWAGEGFTHKHTETAMEDKAPTCTENGYTGRTFCAVCNSVVKWGTIIPATHHEYALHADGHVECINANCEKLFTGFFTGDGKEYVDGIAVQGWTGDRYIIDGKPVTGIYAIDGIYYDFGEDGVNKGKITGKFLDPADHNYSYAINGELKTGWILVDEDWHYFDEKGDAMVGPAVLTDGVKFVFERDGKLHEGVWVTTAAGSRYYYGPAYHKAPGTNFYNKYTMVTIDGNEYCFGVDGYRLEGIQWITKSTDLDQHFWYDFGTDGIARPFGTGFYTIDGGLYYIENGVSTYRGLFEIDGNYYYQRSSHELVVNQNYRITKNNDLLPIDNYDFDKDGKIILPDTTLNGIVEENGELFYYVKGEKTYAGLIKIGEDYYYVNSSCKVVTGSYRITKTNDLLPVDTYEFGEDGKMIREETKKNGIFTEDGVMYYYVDGVKTYAGLIKIGNDYYYVNSSCKVVTGTYRITKTNDLLPVDTYVFGEDGKMVVADTTKEGIIAEDGVLYYYVDGKKNYAGLIKIGEHYYYVNSSCKVVTGMYRITKHNDLLPVDTYEFGADGKMVVADATKEGIVNENGTLYYYVDGKKSYAGLIKIGEDYYYVNSSCKVVTGTYRITKTNDLLPVDTYEFGEDGKMVR